MRGGWGLVVIALVACGKPRQKRGSDAAPVEVVQRSNNDTGGPTTEEVEPNDGDDTATTMALGAPMRGRVEPDTDVDTYRLDITEAGALSIEVSATEGVDLILELDEATGTTIARSDRGGVKIKEGVPNVGVTPGLYRITVKAKRPPPAKPVRKKKGAKVDVPVDAAPAPATPYEIVARVSPVPANAEHEPDDDQGTANDLIVGDGVTGYLGWASDIDVWKLSVETLSEKNAIDVEVSAVEGVALSAEMTDGVGGALVTRRAPRGAALAIRGIVPVVPEGAPPFHYLAIRGDRSNPETAYQLKVSAKVPGPDAEIEPNDVPEKAMAVPEDRTVVHATWTAGDVDCFVLAPESAARTLEVTIEVPDGADLDAELIVDGKSVAVGDKKGKGVLEKFSAAVPANARAVVRVRGTDASTEVAYDVSVQEGVAP